MIDVESVAIEGEGGSNTPPAITHRFIKVPEISKQSGSCPAQNCHVVPRAWRCRSVAGSTLIRGIV
jgi:hypothetical protein